MKIFLVMIFTSVLFISSGCATIFKQKERSVQVDSNPQGAEIFISENSVGVTPKSLRLSNLKSVLLTFKYPGYENTSHYISSSATFGWVLTDYLLGGLIPVLVDGMTSNWNNLDTKAVMVTLLPIKN